MAGERAQRCPRLMTNCSVAVPKKMFESQRAMMLKQRELQMAVAVAQVFQDAPSRPLPHMCNMPLTHSRGSCLNLA